MKKRSFLLACLMMLTIMLSGCGSSSADLRLESVNSAASGYDTEYSYDGESVGIAETPALESSIYQSDSNKIIRTASITIQTTDFDSSTAALSRLTEQLGGYFETSEVESGGYYDQRANRCASYVVRIPRENFAAFRDGSGEIGHVYSIRENTQDVGETYYDTEARLNTLTTKRDRLLELLEEAEKMEDILTLEDALADVQYQIELHTSTLRKYDSLIGYSTFNIRVNEVTEISTEPGEKESFGSKFIAGLTKGFREFGDGLQDFALWVARNLIGIVIFAAVAAAAIILGRRAIRRRRRSKATENS